MLVVLRTVLLNVGKKRENVLTGCTTYHQLEPLLIILSF